jgi:hypothetical protein
MVSECRYLFSCMHLAALARPPHSLSYSNDKHVKEMS